MWQMSAAHKKKVRTDSFQQPSNFNVKLCCEIMRAGEFQPKQSLKLVIVGVNGDVCLLQIGHLVQYAVLDAVRSHNASRPRN